MMTKLLYVLIVLGLWVNVPGLVSAPPADAWPESRATLDAEDSDFEEPDPPRNWKKIAPKYCLDNTVFEIVSGLVMPVEYTDLPACYELDKCLYKYFKTWQLVEKTDLLTNRNHLKMFECAKQAFSVSLVSRLELLSAPEVDTEAVQARLNEIAKTKGQELTEVALYTELSNPPLTGAYRKLVEQLTQLYHKQQQARVPYSPGSLDSKLPELRTLGEQCFIRGLMQLPEQRILDDTYYCRRFMSCLDRLLVWFLNEDLEDHPPRWYWDFYLCTRHTFKSNPAKFRHVPAEPTYTQKCRPKPVPETTHAFPKEWSKWWCYFLTAYC